MCRDGRVRPATQNRIPLHFPRSETTFPAMPGPVITMRMQDASHEDPLIIVLIYTRFIGVLIFLQQDRSDVVQQFVEHRKNKIRKYISEVHARFPIPIQCTVEASKSWTSSNFGENRII